MNRTEILLMAKNIKREKIIRNCPEHANTRSTKTKKSAHAMAKSRMEYTMDKCHAHARTRLIMATFINHKVAPSQTHKYGQNQHNSCGQV